MSLQRPFRFTRSWGVAAVAAGALVGSLMAVPATATVAVAVPSAGSQPAASGPNPDGSYTTIGRALGVNTNSGDARFKNAVIPERLNTAGIGIVRYPGGSGADRFNWRSGGSTTWPQYMATMAQTNAAPLITVNYGQTTVGGFPGPQAAADWVTNALTFANYSDSTALWVLGNEGYGLWETDEHPDPHTPQSYATNVRPYFQAMHAADSNAQVGFPMVVKREVAAGTGTWVADPELWNRTILSQNADQVDWIDFHWYPIFGIPVLSNEQIFETVDRIPSTMQYLRNLIDGYDPGIPIVTSESNISQSEVVYNVQPVAALYAAATALKFLAHGSTSYDWWQVHNTDNMNGDFGFLSDGTGSPGPSATTLSGPVDAGARNVPVATASGFHYAHQFTIGSGDDTESRKITALPGSTTLSAPAAAGDTNVKVATTATFTTAGATTDYLQLFAPGTPVTIGSGDTAESRTVVSAGSGASNATLAAPAAAGDTNVKIVGVGMGGQSIPVFMPVGFAPGGKITIGSGADAETLTITKVGSSSSLGSTTVLPASPGDTTIYVVSPTNNNTGIATYVGDPITIDSGDNVEVGTVKSVGVGAGTATTIVAAVSAGDTILYPASVTGMTVGHKLIVDSGANLELATIGGVGTAAGAARTLFAPASAGDTNVKVSAVAGFVVGQQMLVDTGAAQELRTVATVGTQGGATTLSAATAVGATNIKVASVTGFAVGDTITIDSGANLERRTVASVGTAGATGTGVNLSAPLDLAHASAAAVREFGTGITLTSPLGAAHAQGATTRGLGSGVTVSPLALAHAASAAARDAGTGITLTQPLALAHASGVATRDAGTGITLSAPLAANHANSSTATTPGTGIVLSAPLAFDHASGEATATSGITFTPALGKPHDTGAPLNELGLREPPIDTQLPAYWGYVLASKLTKAGSQIAELSSPTTTVRAFKSFLPGTSETVMLINTDDTKPVTVSLAGMPGAAEAALDTYGYSLETPVLNHGIATGSTTVGAAGAGIVLDPESILVLSGPATDTAPAVALDVVAPLKVTHAADGLNGWNVHAVTVTVTASAEISGSPTCTLDGAAPLALTPGATVLTWTATVTGDGIHTVACTSQDAYGNQSGASDAAIKIDTVAPVTTAQLTPTPVGAWYSPRLVTLNASDGAIGSGIGSIAYRVDGGPWTSYTAPFLIATFGPHTFEYRATDVAGNVEQVKSESWGTSFDASQQIQGLSDFLAGLGPDKGLAKDLQNKLKEAAKKLDRPKDACNQLDEFLKQVLDQAGKNNPKLTVYQAEQLLAANQIEVLLGCIPASSTAPAAEVALLELGATIDGLGLEKGLADDLGNRVRETSKKVADGKTGDACHQLGDLSKKIAEQAVKGKLTAAQAAELNAAVAHIGTQLGC